MTDVVWKEMFPGSRLAPVIDKLRNAHGFTIFGDGRVTVGICLEREGPYFMPDTEQLPTMIAVTPAMKGMYYGTEHWRFTRSKRLQYDGYSCVACGETEDLRVHHMIYNLFNEAQSELITLCEDCHRMAHDQSRLKFPSGMTVEQAESMGADIQFDEWLTKGAREYGSLVQLSIFDCEGVTE